MMVFKITDNLSGYGPRFCNTVNDFNFVYCQSLVDIVYQNSKVYCALKKLQLDTKARYKVRLMERDWTYQQSDMLN